MRHGYIREQKDIKYLILYCLSFVPMPISQTDLMDVVFIDDGFGYFEYSEAFLGLIEHKHVSEIETEGEKKYVITLKGKEVLKLLVDDLPLSVRDKAQKAVMRVLAKNRRDESIKISHAENEDGSFSVKLATHDTSGNVVLAIDLMAFTPRQCTIIENNYKKYAELVYKKMIDMLFTENGENLK